VLPHTLSVKGDDTSILEQSNDQTKPLFFKVFLVYVMLLASENGLAHVPLPTLTEIVENTSQLFFSHLVSSIFGKNARSLSLS
jgi:hypothetical protein